MAARQVWQRISHYSWLVLALGCLFFALVFWAIADKDTLHEVDRVDAGQTQLAIQPEKVTATPNLGNLSDEVRPLEVNTRVASFAQHDPEFRGSAFLQSHKNQWTLELFRVSDEDLIKTFLNTVPSRQNFIYFRLKDAAQEEQFVLLYGLFSRKNEAENQLGKLGFSLPAALHPQAVALSSYSTYVDDLGADELNGSSAQMRTVILRNAPIPVAPPPPTVQPQSNPQFPTTQTTVVRRDAQGNIVDVERSRNHATQQPPVQSPNSTTPSPSVPNTTQP